jgi:hypothetical protein
VEEYSKSPLYIVLKTIDAASHGSKTIAIRGPIPRKFNFSIVHIVN